MNKTIPTDYEFMNYYGDPALYTVENLSEALAEAQKYAEEGYFVVMEEWHEEKYDDAAFEEVMEREPENSDDEGYDEWEEEYYDVIENLYDYPLSVNVILSTAVYPSRKYFQDYVKENPEYFQRSNNSCIYLVPSEDFDGFESDFDHDSLNRWRGWHAFVKVFYEPAVPLQENFDEIALIGKRYDTMHPDLRLQYFMIQRDIFMTSDMELVKLTAAAAAHEVLRAELRFLGRNPIVEAAVLAFEKEENLETATGIFSWTEAK